MKIHYDDRHDLLYFRFDSRRQELRNEDVADGVVLDIGDDDRIVGIEILDASKRLDIAALLPAELVHDAGPAPARP
ncbi:MAG TPA: DUF2283 domain-containing protein [Tepidiformaceae bacterium]|nr:DUF2283 domain-containing protein [Tepidiformaceae bacterium]